MPANPVPPPIILYPDPTDHVAASREMLCRCDEEAAATARHVEEVREVLRRAQVLLARPVRGALS